MASVEGMASAHCPHCLLPIAGARLPFPPQAMRCPHCRLIIGQGRARVEASGEDGDARSRGSAAGVLANAARRLGSEPGDREVVMAALRGVAAEVGCAVDRLRMLDYQEATDADAALPSLGVVLATFHTWKVARAEAAIVTTSRIEAEVVDETIIEAGVHPAVVVECAGGARSAKDADTAA